MLNSELKSKASSNMLNTGKFAQKTVVITGASRGIGKEIAMKLAKDGANIVICAKTTTPHPKLPGTIYTAADDIVKNGGKALPCVVDVRDEQSVTAAVEAAVKEFGGIDILVNNASAISLTGTLETPMKRYDLMHNINTRGTFLMSQKCIPYLRQAKNPHILNLSPPLLMETQWFQHHVAYTMAKYGMSMCVLGMHEELRTYGIAVNALWPKTAIWTAAMEMLSAGGGEAGSRKPAIIADAAYVMLSRNSRDYTGNFAIDEDVLKSEGVTDFEQYACVPGAPLMPDFFVPGISYEAALAGGATGGARAKSRNSIKAADLASIVEAFRKEITPQMVERIGALFEFELKDGSKVHNLYIDLKSGKGSADVGKAPAQPEAHLEMSIDDFGEMFHGKFSPTQAFMAKKLKIKGSMAKAIQLENIFKGIIKSRKSKL